MIYRKIPIHLVSLLKIINQSPIHNVISIGKIISHKSASIRLKNKLNFLIDQLIDILIINDVILSDCYSVKSLIKPKYIIDIGAGFGDFSIYASLLFPQAKIISFEPNPNSADLFEQNILKNKIKNIQLLKAAVGSKKSYQLYLDSNNSRSSIVNNRHNLISVTGADVNKFINQDVDLLKIDCEGAEIDILKSIKTDKFKKIKKLVVEYHNNLIDNDDKKIIQILTSQGFKINKKADKMDKNIGLIFAKKNED